LTEAELILADLILLKLPVGRQLDVVGFMGSHLLEGKQDQFPQQILDEINKIIASRRDVIRTFLLKEKYISVVNHMVPWDMITDKGNKAQELDGHSKYKEWEQKETDRIKRDQNKINWPQKNWWVILILSTIIFPIITGLILEGRKKPSNQSHPTIQVVHDTVYIHDIGANQDTLKKSLPIDTIKN
jgi:hypothetical protein